MHELPTSLLAHLATVLWRVAGYQAAYAAVLLAGVVSALLILWPVLSHLVLHLPALLQAL